MLVYDACRLHLIKAEPFDVVLLHDAAGIIRNFVEDYHEMLEEKYLFPRFVNAGVMVELIQMLYIQHHAGRSLTDRILSMSVSSVLQDPVKAVELISLLEQFNLMYRMHEAREDTVIFPEIRKIVTGHEYGALGENFEKIEHEKLGSGGFEAQVEKVAEIEKKLGIYELSSFTPAV
jgi:hemerythrin-like domain-containing protein